MIVERRWAITTVVRSRITSVRAFWSSYSVLESSELVASSRTRIGGSLSNVRAIITRCFSPPDSLTPRSPTMLLYPRGSFFIK